MNRKRIQFASGFLCCLLFVGCGDNLPPRAPVKGKVTWNGKPLDRGTITFYPTTGRPAIGKIAASGDYQLTTFAGSDGALLGSHTVTIEALVASAQADAPKSMEEEAERVLKGTGRPPPPKYEWLVPSDYSRRETSPLTAEVQAGENVIDFNLP